MLWKVEADDRNRQRLRTGVTAKRRRSWRRCGAQARPKLAFALRSPCSLVAQWSCSAMYDEDGDPAGPPMRDPRAPIHPGELLDPREVDSVTEIVTLCARIVDRFAQPERVEDTLGDVLRARLFER
jgi:hypothetical protein